MSFFFFSNNPCAIMVNWCKALSFFLLVPSWTPGIFDDFPETLTVEAVERLGYSPFSRGKIIYGHERVPVDVIRLVMDDGLMDVNAVDNEGISSLFYALRNADLPAFQELLIQGAKGSDEMLRFAAEHGYSVAIKLLMKRFVPTQRIILQALREAAFKGQTESVRVLLERTESLTLPDSHGHDPLLAAAQSNSDVIPIFKMLLLRGSSIASVDERQRNGIFLCLRRFLLVAASEESEAQRSVKRRVERNFQFLWEAAGTEAYALLKAESDNGQSAFNLIEVGTIPLETLEIVYEIIKVHKQVLSGGVA